MWSNPLLAQLLAEELMRDAMREAERARLIRAAEGSKEGARTEAANDGGAQLSAGSLHATAELMTRAAGLGQSHRIRPGRGTEAVDLKWMI